MGKSLQIATGLRLPGSELLDTADASYSAFGLKKLAVCTTDAGKIYALDMADGSVAWYVDRSSGPRGGFAPRCSGFGLFRLFVFVGLGCVVAWPAGVLGRGRGYFRCLGCRSRQPAGRSMTPVPFLTTEGCK